MEHEKVPTPVFKKAAAAFKTPGQILDRVAGIGGIALLGFVVVIREIVAKEIFPPLTPERGFLVILTIVILTWFVAVIGIAAWIYTLRRSIH